MKKNKQQASKRENNIIYASNKLIQNNSNKYAGYMFF